MAWAITSPYSIFVRGPDRLHRWSGGHYILRSRVWRLERESRLPQCRVAASCGIPHADFRGHTFCRPPRALQYLTAGFLKVLLEQCGHPLTVGLSVCEIGVAVIRSF